MVRSAERGSSKEPIIGIANVLSSKYQGDLLAMDAVMALWAGVTLDADRFHCAGVGTAARRSIAGKAWAGIAGWRGVEGSALALHAYLLRGASIAATAAMDRARCQFELRQASTIAELLTECAAGRHDASTIDATLIASTRHAACAAVVEAVIDIDAIPIAERQFGTADALATGALFLIAATHAAHAAIGWTGVQVGTDGGSALRACTCAHAAVA